MPGSVFVSGTSSGIGQACVRLLAERGFRVLAGVRKAGDTEMWAGDERIVPVVVDLASPDQIQDAAHALDGMATQWPLQAVVNNAGVMLTGSVEAFSMAHLRSLFEANLFGHWHLTQLCIPLLRRTGGRIVNIGSTNGRMSAPGLAAYSASKHALEAFTETLYMELHEQGLSVSIVEPGAVRTELWRKVIAWESARPPLEGQAQESKTKRLEKLEFLQARSPGPEHVARAVLRAIQDRKPAYRYVVGADARARVALVSLLPRRALFALRRLKG
jgi:NAD(P)-dependent dehydrogenase (short-subunit alcohol dehydrogenase family)